jgi:hypothetical protein
VTLSFHSSISLYDTVLNVLSLEKNIRVSPLCKHSVCLITGLSACVSVCDGCESLFFRYKSLETKKKVFER